MILHKFHVAQRHTVSIGQCHAVAGDDATIGVLAKHTPRATGRNDDRSGFDQREFARGNINHHCTLRASILNQQLDTKMFVKTFDRRVFDRGLKQGMQHVKTGFVGCEPGALYFHAAKRADINVPVGFAAPRTPPMFQLHHFFGAMGHKIIDHVLLAQPIAAGNGIVKMMFQTIV